MKRALFIGLLLVLCHRPCFAQTSAEATPPSSNPPSDAPAAQAPAAPAAPSAPAVQAPVLTTAPGAQAPAAAAPASAPVPAAPATDAPAGDAAGTEQPSDAAPAAAPQAPSGIAAPIVAAPPAGATDSTTGYLLVPIEPIPPELGPHPKRKKRAPPPPRRHGNAGAPFAVAVGGGFVWNDDRGYALVTGERIPQLEVFASYDVLQPIKPLVISLGASLRHHASSEQLLEIADSTLQADVMARWGVRSWLWPHLRGGIGSVWTRVNLDGAEGGGTIDERDRALAGTLGGGLTLRTPTRTFETHQGRFASLSLGVLVEGGYTFAKDARIVGTPGGGTSDIDRSPVNLGRLERSAPYMRIMGVIRF